MTQYSPSRLSTFEQCRLKFKYQYKDRIKREEDSIEAFLGSRFHEVMEKVYAERAFWKPAIDDLRSYFNELWDKKWGDHVFVVRNDRQPDDYRQVGLKALEDYHKRYAPFQDGRVLGIERRVSAPLTDSGFEIFGFIDRIMETEDGHYEIHDYKTSGSLPTQAYLDADRQLALYEIAVRQTWPNDVKHVDLVWHYVAFDKEMRSKRTPEQLEELKKTTISLIETIEKTDDYPPNESNLCRWCNYQDICPLFAHKFRTEVLPKEQYANEDGVSLVNQLAKLDARKRELEADLAVVKEEMGGIITAAIDFAMKDGVTRLFGADRELNIKDDITVEYPRSKDSFRDEFEKAMHELNIWEQVSSLNAQSFKSFAKKHGWLASVPKEVADFVKVTPIKTARLSRPKEETKLM